MATRQTITSATVGPVTGDDYMDNVAAHIGRFYDAAAFPLTGVGGTGNAVTATLDPVLAAGLVAGMKFTVTWGATNSGGVTLAINGGAAVAVLDVDGSAMTTGALKSNRRSLIEYIGGAFRILAGAGGGGAAAAIFQQFTMSGTWTKPSGYPDDHMVLIEAWGGGGGGQNQTAGGGGGGYMRRWMRYIDLPSSVTVQIGAGGSVGAGGGNTTFGALVTAYGGAPGSFSGGADTGGGGGGAVQAGAGLVGGFQGGGNGANAAATPGGSATIESGGGGGGAGTAVGTATAALGGRAIYGGGGGGGRSGNSANHGAGGLSLFGGPGGSGAVAGQAPGGGGGGNAAGARGEVRVWL